MNCTNPFHSLGRRLAIVAAVAAWPLLAQAQAPYPPNTLKIIVPTNPGGSLDMSARILANELKNKLGHPVIVENKAGAGGLIAAAAVAAAPADGSVVLLTHTGVMQADILHKQSTLQRLVPVAELANLPMVFGVSYSMPVNNIQEFVALVKKQPGKISYGSYGKGTSAHIWAEQFSQGASITMLHVPYKGEAPAMQDLLAGSIHGAFGSTVNYRQQAEEKKIRILAIANPKRSAMLPDVPTFIEAGYPAMSASGWSGVFLPAATPKEIVTKLSDAIVAIARDPNVVVRLQNVGQEATGVGSDDFGSRVVRDRATWAKAIADFNITLD